MKDVRDRFVDVGARLVGPSTAARDRAGSFDRALWQQLGAAGLFRLETLQERAAGVEGLALGSADLGLAVSVCAHFVVVGVLESEGSATQQERWLPGLRDGSLVGACANAEAAAGTDLMGLKSRARVVDDGVLLSARKRSITNLGACDVALVSARVLDVPAREAVNIFVVDAHGPRVQQRLRTDLAGLRTSPTGSLVAWRAPLGSDSRIGAAGDGVRLFRKMFSEERITTGFLYLGSLKASRDRALRHAETRKQFGQAIGRNQYVQEKIVKMQVAIDLLEAHLWRVTQDHAAGVDVHGSLSVVKVFGVEAALQAAQDLVRLLGSRGVSVEEPAERAVRDLLGLSILGGTVELMKMIIYDEARKRC
ncbi:MAG: acyl-CoA dehydrogenase family protein [Deltaproteobacteria bacterium]|nr:acyl-CoA dehydrogenase family protein [Deltaproteobacteria bacterium]